MGEMKIYSIAFLKKQIGKMIRRLLHKINRFNMKLFDPCRVNALSTRYLIKIGNSLIQHKADIFQQKHVRIEKLLECGFFFSQHRLFKIISVESATVFYNILCNTFQLRPMYEAEDCRNEIQIHELVDDPFKNESVPYGNNETVLCLNIVKFYKLSELPFLSDFRQSDGEGVKMYLMKIQLIIQSIEFQVGFIKDESLKHLYGAKLRKIKSLGLDCVLKVQRTRYQKVLFTINELF